MRIQHRAVQTRDAFASLASKVKTLVKSRVRLMVLVALLWALARHSAVILSFQHFIRAHTHGLVVDEWAKPYFLFFLPFFRMALPMPEEPEEEPEAEEVEPKAERAETVTAKLCGRCVLRSTV